MHLPGTAKNISEPFAAVAAAHRALPAIEMLHGEGVDTVTWGELREWAERTAADRKSVV